MTQDEMVACFESVLVGAFGCDPAECREGDRWWRFGPDGATFQGGIHTSEVRVQCSLGELATDADMDALYDRIRAANGTEATAYARVAEVDNYLVTRGAVSFEAFDAGTLESMIRDCAALAKSPQTRAVYSSFRRW